MTVKTIIWDWNGTLLDDLAAVVAVNNFMLKNRQLPTVTTQFYLDYFDFPVRDYYRLVGFDFQKEPFEQIAKEYMNRYMEMVPTCPLQKGALDCLQSFKEAGIKQYILSAKEENLLQQTVPKYKIDHFFEEIAGINSVTAEGKIERGRELLDKHRIDPTCAFFIGDTTHDHHVAIDYKMTPLLQCRGHHSRWRLEKASRNVFTDLLEIKEYLNKLC